MFGAEQDNQPERNEGEPLELTSPRQRLEKLVAEARESRSVTNHVFLLNFVHTWDNRETGEKSNAELSIWVNKFISKTLDTVHYFRELALVVPKDIEREIPKETEFRMSLVVKSNPDRELGTITGILEVRIVNNAFIASGVRNFDFQKINQGEDEQVTHIPYALTVAICQLVQLGVFDQWYSAAYSHHTEHGRKMLERIERIGPDFGLKVTRLTTEDGGWVVERNELN